MRRPSDTPNSGLPFGADIINPFCFNPDEDKAID